MNQPANQNPHARHTSRPNRRFLQLLMALALLPLTTGSAADSHLDQTLSLNDARHLLARTGFGATPGELLRYTGKSRRWAIQTRVDELKTEPSSTLPQWVDAPAPHYWARGRMPRDGRRHFDRARDEELVDLRQWWVRELIETSSPQTEKLTLFWHNHFTSSYADINRQSTSIARQHNTLRRLSAGSFRDLLVAMLRDPAMLNYLDNTNNHKRAPNENFARELLELFTLGEGHYTERDIRDTARALTGYSVAPQHNMSPRFKPWKHDNGLKTILGQRGYFSADDLADLILAQPRAAVFISEKFYRAFINEHTPDPEVINYLAEQFRQSGYDLKTLYKKLLQSEAFWIVDNRNAIVKSPLDLVIGTIRSTGIVPRDWQTLPSQLASMGQNLFQPPNVAGWPGADHWVTPDRLLTRLNWLSGYTADDCQQTGQQGCIANSNNTMMMSGMNDDADAAHLTIQLAAENYQGAPGYQVALIKDQQDVWRSAEQIVNGGHDTKALGRLEPGVDMPWQQVSLPIGKQVPAFDQIRVSFLNDTRGRDGDRNLYINWVEIDAKRYPASLGEQRSNCPPKQKDRAGALYCTGDLALSKPLPVEGVTAAPPNLLSAEAIYLNWLNDPQKHKRPTLAFTLTGVQLNQHQWHNLGVRFHVERNGSYSMSVENHECWPDCVERWPACARTADNQPELRALDFPLQTTTDDFCHYRLLGNSDQRLVDTLWMQLPFLYREVSKNARHLRKSQSAILKRWQPHVHAMQQRLAQSIYNQSTTRDIQVTGTRARKLKSRALSSNPLAAGQPSEKHVANLAQLQKRIPELSLSSLLLAADDDTGDDTNSLGPLLQKLSYQLY